MAALALWAPGLRAQVGLASGTATVALTATKAASVSLSLPAGTSATLPGTLVIGPNDFAPITVTTAWEVDPQRTAAVSLVAYFQQPARALASASAAIPASAVLGRVPSGGPKGFAPFVGAPISGGNAVAGAAGGTLVLFTQPIAGANAIGGRSDNLQMRIDLTGAPELPAGSYTGILNLLVITQ
ncbi:MAG TPA: hypothetical protein VFJ81_16530 [Gemmatimonadales bacterium]|nr:hypothetical protein [Gemmatimonadales bacterium]